MDVKAENSSSRASAGSPSAPLHASGWRLPLGIQLLRWRGTVLPAAHYADIVSRTEHTYAQLIYTVDLPAYARDRICLIGDAGIVVQPFTGSGIFKGFNSARDLVAALEEHDRVDEGLAQWSQAQTVGSKRILALGRQMEQAFIWSPLAVCLELWRRHRQLPKFGRRPS